MYLPVITERSTKPFIESKKNFSPTNLFQPQSLSQMFKNYILPTVQSTPKMELKNERRIKQSCKKRNQNRSQPISILHENLVYLSARNSREVVSKNKIIYEKMQEIMKNKEVNELLAAFRLCKEEQRQLKFLEQHKRVVPSKETEGTVDEESNSPESKNRLLNLYLIGLSKFKSKRTSGSTTLYITYSHYNN